MGDNSEESSEESVESDGEGTALGTTHLRGANDKELVHHLGDARFFVLHGFALIENRAMCVWDGYPPELSDACRTFAVVCRGADRRSADLTCVYRQVPQPYLVLQMDYAGIPLSSIRALSVRQIVSAFKQMILALAAAETGLNFEHRHLTLDNVFVKRVEEQVVEWKLSGQAFHVETMGVMAYIGNFGAARVDADGDAQFADPQPLWEDYEKDCALNDIHKRIKEEINDDWGSYCPRTNVLFAYHVSRELGERRVRGSPDDPRDARDWDAFQAWKFRLPWFPSVAEFAHSAFANRDTSGTSRKISSAVAVLEKLVSKPLSPFLSGSNGR
ncbi:hypothetical protein V5799_019763 [Amblyomma americanum]|uniref:Protein kinase domain-containing protein n=1 Tax=Amblyomma americanum TaxID=6943 RepID=A0AAQ4EWN2_AMBAM